MRVLIYGATGLTGRLVAEALLARDIAPILAGRDATRLAALQSELGADLETRVARVHDGAELARCFEGIDLVINCAGPFTVLGPPVVRAAIEAGAHYVDTTGEQGFMRDVYERFESRARRAEVLVVNGLAFEIAVGDWAASLAAARLGGEVADEITVSYAVDNFRPSRGTQLSAIESMANPGYVWNVDRWDTVVPASETRMVHFPAPFGERLAMSFPSGEVVSVPRHARAARVQSYIALGPDSPWARMLTRATQIVGVAIPVLMRSPLVNFARSRVGANPRPPGDDERSASRFAIVAEASRRFERTRVAVSGSDIYGLTAEIVARGAQWIARERPPSGVLAPAQAFDAEASLTEIAGAWGLEVQRS
jgi:short subunit dehydrogenase-like uncharacterized protein